MNLYAITLVQESVAQIMPQADTAADLLYRRLFELDPALRPLFPADLAPHGRAVLAALRQMVDGLGAAETVVPLLKQLGRRHAHNRVQAAHYHTFGQAWLWTLAHLLGDDFTPELREAWAEAYCLLSGLMKEAAVQPGQE
jgi:hemoglobin-like flavoprotein